MSDPIKLVHYYKDSEKNHPRDAKNSEKNYLDLSAIINGSHHQTAKEAKIKTISEVVEPPEKKSEKKYILWTQVNLWNN